MSNYRSGNLVQGQSFGAVSTTVLLTQAQQAINPGLNQIIYLYSSTSTAANASFYLESTAVIGQEVTLVFESPFPNACKTYSSSNWQLYSDWAPYQYGSLTVSWDGNFWVEVCRSNTLVDYSGIKQDVLSQTSLIPTLGSAILTLNTIPITLVPAPLSSQFIQIQNVNMIITNPATGFTTTGSLYVGYGTTTPIVAFPGSILATVGANTYFAEPTIYGLDTSGTGTPFTTTVPAGKAIQLYCNNAVTGGNPFNVIAIQITYTVVTLA